MLRGKGGETKEGRDGGRVGKRKRGKRKSRRKGITGEKARRRRREEEGLNIEKRAQWKDSFSKTCVAMSCQSCMGHSCFEAGLHCLPFVICC